MMGRRQKLKTSAEVDVVYGWRRYYCYLGKSGVAKAIKRAMNKRERREAKEALREADE